MHLIQLFSLQELLRYFRERFFLNFLFEKLSRNFFDQNQQIVREAFIFYLNHHRS